MQRDENEFRIRIGRSASDVRPALKQVRAGVRRASASTPKGGSPVRQSSVRAHFAKGSASHARPLHVTQRRVVVKARFVPEIVRFRKVDPSANAAFDQRLHSRASSPNLCPPRRVGLLLVRGGKGGRLGAISHRST